MIQPKRTDGRKALRLPQILADAADVYVVPLRLSEPNFITHKSIFGHSVLLGGHDQVPGNMADVITVGAVAWDTGRLQPYSAWGPNHMGDRKPEVVGPDETATSGWVGADNTGTSYAAPHVAGLVALMLGAGLDGSSRA